MISERETEQACGGQGAENYRRTEVLSLINFCVSNFHRWVDRQNYFHAEISRFTVTSFKVDCRKLIVNTPPHGKICIQWYTSNADTLGD